MCGPHGFRASARRGLGRSAKLAAGGAEETRPPVGFRPMGVWRPDSGQPE